MHSLKKAYFLWKSVFGDLHFIYFLLWPVCCLSLYHFRLFTEYELLSFHLYCVHVHRWLTYLQVELCVFLFLYISSFADLDLRAFHSLQAQTTSQKFSDQIELFRGLISVSSDMDLEKAKNEVTEYVAPPKRLAYAVKAKSVLLPEKGPLPVYKVPLVEEDINIPGCKQF